MHDKNAYVEKMEAKLEQIDAKIKEVRAKAKEAKADTRIKLEKQARSVSEKKEEFLAMLEGIKEVSEEKWEEMKVEAETAWENLKQSIDEALTA